MGLVLQPDGPGTTIDLRDGLQGLPSAPRGTGAIMGQFGSGPVDHAALVFSTEHVRLVSGEANDDYQGSLTLGDLYTQDAPPVLIARVTDGNEIQSLSRLYDRDPNRSYLHRTADVERAFIGTAKAHNGGRWGGQRRVFLGDVNMVTDVGTSTVDLGATVLEDIFEGGTITFEGDTGNSYEVVSNTAAGVVTVKGEWSQAVQDADGSGSIDGRLSIVLEGGCELAVVIGPDSSTGREFQLSAQRKFKDSGDWERVTLYGNLGLNAADSKPWLTTIRGGEEDGAYQVEISSTYTGSTVEEKLPSNFSEIPLDVTDNVLTFQWYRWFAAVGNTGDSYIENVVAGSDVREHRVQVDFTAPTAYTVTVVWPDGSSQLLVDPGAAGTPYAAKFPEMAGFTVSNGLAPATGDRLIIDVAPMPSDLAGREAYLYPIANPSDGNAAVRVRIADVTYDTISVRSDLDLSALGASAAVAAQVVGSTVITAAIWVAAETLIFTLDGVSPAVTFTGAGEVGAPAILAALTAADTAGLFSFGVDANGRLTVQSSTSVGSQSRVQVGAGTANTTFGFAGTEDEYGTDGVPFRVEARWPMWGGYDGIAPDSADYVLALDLSGSVFTRHMNRNLGLVRLATPGVTAQAVKDAAEALARQTGWIYIAEFASSLEASATPGEAAVLNMTSNEIQSDFVEHYFPSNAQFLNVARTKLVERSVSGLIIGLRARMANVGIDGERGMHIAAANNNEQGRLSPIVKGLPLALGRWSPPIGLMNDNGIVPILWDGPDIYLYGNRMYSLGRTPHGSRYTITERAVYYHVARDLFITTRPIIFKSISARRLGDVMVQLRTKMKMYWRDGWFSDANGQGFEQQVIVDVPLDLNPPNELQEGRITAKVQFRPRPALEDLLIIISPTELTSEG